MVTGGNATVFVSDFDRSIRFYTEVLGCRLMERYGNDWATLKAGDSLTIGLHPASPNYPKPGTSGAIVLGLSVQQPMEDAVARLERQGVKTQGGITRSQAGNFAHIADPDGNALYLWEHTR